jgi:predicted SAM-dependent methyltransferase
MKAVLMPLLRPPYRAARSAADAVVSSVLLKRARRRLSTFKKPYKLNLGCGRVPFAGWVNIDANGDLDAVDLVWDLRRGLPVEDGSCALIYCEHMLEHLKVEQGLAFLKGCQRALGADGLLRVAMPSLDFILERATSENWRDQDWLTWSKHRDVQTRAEMLNVAFRNWGHEYLYDREELHRRLREAGFSRIVDVELGHSEHEELRNRESRKDSFLVCEARR